MTHKLLSLLSLTILATQAAVIVPGATWTDTSGNVIQAHGGGILKVGSTFYWHGEDKAHNSGLFRAVSCYSVGDLALLCIVMPLLMMISPLTL
jgi:hypothetical protein